MADVSFHVGTSAPGTSGLTTGGLYFNTSGGGIYYASSATARSQVASKVSFSRNLTSGTKVGTITINGTGTDLYCQTNTDEKCAYTSSSTNAEYPLLFKSSTSSTTTAGKPYFDTGITVNPYTNKITASLFNGYLVPKLVASGTGSKSYKFTPGFYTVTWRTTSDTFDYSASFYYRGESLQFNSGSNVGGLILSDGTMTWDNHRTVFIYLWGT